MVPYAYMANGIGKGVGNQLGEIGKQVGRDLLSIPKSMLGMDKGTGEKAGAGAGGKKQQTLTPQKQQTSSEQVDPLVGLRQKEEIETQQRLAQIRKDLTQQFTKPQGLAQEKTIHEQQELETLEKKKQEIVAMQEDAQKTLNQPGAKQKKGLLGGKMVKKQKTFGSEQSKNAVHQ